MSDYTFKYLKPDTEVVTRGLVHGPSSIEGEYDEALAAPETVFRCEQAAREGFDGIFVNCFGDPGVRAAREAVDVPVFGGFEPVMHLAMGTADRIAIITVLPHPVSMLNGSVAKARLEGRVVCIRNIDMPVLDLQDHEKVVTALTEQAVLAIQREHAEAIVLGCTGFIDVREDVRYKLTQAGYDAPVLEAAQAAMVTLEAFVTMGLHHSRLTYLPPREKDRHWWPA
ncbi:aspartate/glutamate racemase family protein [Gluconacetobacter sp. Hr-1-5]|uniref:aspartate/glutamate racemase family protein n=1 Tax=Gluconacetobacter sp. Hr-1-5 TaxID=3395370 RepID=UPI003B520141